MKTWGLIKNDIWVGIKSRKIRISIVLSIIMFMFLTIEVDDITRNHDNNIINFLYGSDYTHEGIKITMGTDGNIKRENDIPLKWILINIMVCTIFIDYFKEDFKKRGHLLFTRISKSKYYVVKSISLFISIFFFYICLFMGLIVANYTQSIEYIKEMTWAFVLYTLTSFTLLLLHNSLSLFINSKISLTLCIISILGVVKFDSPLVIGQHSIIARHIPFSKYNYLTNEKSTFYIILFISIISICSYILINSKRGIEERDYERSFRVKECQ